jgi:hypothetical protein
MRRPIGMRLVTLLSRTRRTPALPIIPPSGDDGEPKWYFAWGLDRVDPRMRVRWARAGRSRKSPM